MRMYSVSLFVMLFVIISGGCQDTLDTDESGSAMLRDVPGIILKRPLYHDPQNDYEYYYLLDITAYLESVGVIEYWGDTLVRHDVEGYRFGRIFLVNVCDLPFELRQDSTCVLVTGDPIPILPSERLIAQRIRILVIQKTDCIE